ncbi:MAG: tetratricopeptide repeat protein [Candidatus Kapabacteria bacterium]|nr:tetratricopeptide repeat protein [Candidatus Kapabacteria bacterium]
MMKLEAMVFFKRRIILFSWSILIISIMVTLNSCTMPQSINGKNNDYKKLQNYKLNNEISNSKSTQKSNQAIDTSNIKLDENELFETTSSDTRIPTLREQIKSVSDRQDEIDRKIETLTYQVNQLEEEIQNLKQDKTNHNSQLTIITGEDQKNNQLKSENKLLSDETLAQAKPNSNKNISTKSNSKTTNIKKAQYKSNINNAKLVNDKSTNNPQIPTTNANSSNQADSYINQKNFSEAEKILVSQLNKEPKSQNADSIKIKLARCYLENGDTQKAKAIYENILKTSPKSAYSPIAKKMLQQL